MPTNSLVSQLVIGQSGKLFKLVNPLKSTDVRELFKSVLSLHSARKIGASDVRKKITGFPPATRYSWLCFCTEPSVSFLSIAAIKEKRYGFLLLVEHRGLLGLFARGVSGIEEALEKSLVSLPRDKMMHLWGDSARYEKLSAKRMALGNTELLGVRYEARDLQTSMPPAGAGRSIPTSFRLAVDGEPNRAVTPSTGRIQKSGERVGLENIVQFVDEVADELAANHTSAFMGAFSVPIEIKDLPAGVRPTGLLLDASELKELVEEGSDWALVNPNSQITTLYEQISEVFILANDPNNPDRWMNTKTGVEQLRVKELTSSYSLTAKFLEGWGITNAVTNENKPLGKWFHQKQAFRISFSNPEFFYIAGNLYRRASFADDASLVLKLLEEKQFLVGADSEKGDARSYNPQTQNFDQNSIFRRLEINAGPQYPHFICSDLNDEWADYLGITANEIAFFHCKHRELTAGASAFQDVVAQAQKNLGRIKLQPADISKKLIYYQQNPLWVSTKGISRLVQGDWMPALATSVTAIADPNTNWKVVLVVTALSKSAFQSEMVKPTLEPHFIQLVWLLSTFISICRERDARPSIWCLP